MIEFLCMYLGGILLGLVFAVAGGIMISVLKYTDHSSNMDTMRYKTAYTYTLIFLSFYTFVLTVMILRG